MIWKYFIQICKGLQHLHQNNIIHRDIKPANIFVGEHDIVKANEACLPIVLMSSTAVEYPLISEYSRLQVGDLGIAKLVKDGVARTQIGTPHCGSSGTEACHSSLKEGEQ